MPITTFTLKLKPMSFLRTTALVDFFLALIIALQVLWACSAEASPRMQESPAVQYNQSTKAVTWQAIKATDLPGYQYTALSGADLIIAWTEPRDLGINDRIAREAFLLVDSDLSSVEPLLKKTLSSLGTFEFSTTKIKLGHWSPAWFEVLVSRRPDLCNALFERSIKPILEKIIAESSLSAKQKEERIRIVWRNYTGGLISQGRASLPEFQTEVQVTQALLSKKYGFLLRSKSAQTVEIIDVSAAFGRPMTGVKFQQWDTYHNTGSGIKTFFNLGSGGNAEPSSFDLISVPAVFFDTVRAALISNLSDNKVQVAASPVEWALTRGFCEVEGPTKIQIKGESSFSRQ